MKNVGVYILTPRLALKGVETVKVFGLLCVKGQCISTLVNLYNLQCVYCTFHGAFNFHSLSLSSRSEIENFETTLTRYFSDSRRQIENC